MKTLKELQVDRELDAWISECVYGMHFAPSKLDPKYTCCLLPKGVTTYGDIFSKTVPYDEGRVSIGSFEASENRTAIHYSPMFSSGIVPAWRLLEKCIVDKGEVVTLGYYHYGSAYTVDGNAASAKAPTLPLAIARFAKKLFEV